jgi:hypothetical protein
LALVGCETDRDHHDRGRPAYDYQEYRGYGYQDRDDYYRDHRRDYQSYPNYQFSPGYQYGTEYSR